MPLVLARIDDRLIHGQVVEGWLRVIQAQRIVVANDRAAADPLQGGLMRLAVPDEVALDVLTVDAATARLKDNPWGNERVMVLFGSVADLARAVEAGAPADPGQFGRRARRAGAHPGHAAPVVEHVEEKRAVAGLVAPRDRGGHAVPAHGGQRSRSHVVPRHGNGVTGLLSALLYGVLSIDHFALGPFLLSRPLVLGALLGTLWGRPAEGLALGLLGESLWVVVPPAGPSQWDTGLAVALACVWAFSPGVAVAPGDSSRGALSGDGVLGERPLRGRRPMGGFCGCGATRGCWPTTPGRGSITGCRAPFGGGWFFRWCCGGSRASSFFSWRRLWAGRCAARCSRV
jgi:mannose/fructose/N-acetylgalactosamine-specific phosphotransferase system component IIB